MSNIQETTKTIKIIVRSWRSFNDDFVLYAANLSKGEELVLVSFTITEVTPDVGYQKQYEILYTFTDLIIGQNDLTIKLIGQDGIERISTYTVIREYAHEETTTIAYINQLPTIYDPFPADITNVNREVQLSWSLSDPDPSTTVYDVFFGKSESPNLVSSDQSLTLYPLTSTMMLDAGNTYAWKVIAKEQSGGITESPTWTFRVTYAPDAPNTPIPVNNSIEVTSTGVVLFWQTQSQDSNSLTYDVYFGATSTPSKITGSPISTPMFNIGTLASNTTYYWYVVVYDNKNNTVPGPKWKFKTGT